MLEWFSVCPTIKVKPLLPASPLSGHGSTRTLRLNRSHCSLVFAQGDRVPGEHGWRLFQLQQKLLL